MKISKRYSKDLDVDFVECGILQKNGKNNFNFNKDEIALFIQKNDIFTFWAIPHFPNSTKFIMIPWSSAREIRFLGHIQKSRKHFN